MTSKTNIPITRFFSFSIGTNRALLNFLFFISTQVAGQARRRRRNSSARPCSLCPLPAAARGDEAHHHGTGPGIEQRRQTPNWIFVRKKERKTKEEAKGFISTGRGRRGRRRGHHLRGGRVVLPASREEEAGCLDRTAEHRKTRTPAEADARSRTICRRHST